MQLLFTQILETLLKIARKYGYLWHRNFNNNEDSKKAIRHIMHVVVLLLLIPILISKTVCRLSFRFFPVLITWLVKYERDSKIWKDSSIERISANSLAEEALAFKI